MPWKAFRSRCRPWRTPWGRSARRSILSFALWKAMSWRLRPCLRVRRPYRFWPREKPTPGDAGYIYATTDPLAEPGHPRRYFTTHAIAGASILRAIWQDMPASCKRTPMTGTTSSISPDEVPGSSLEAACWVHARRPFFAMADIEENARRKASGKKEIALSPIAIEIVRRIDALFEIERSINGKSPEERLAVRRVVSRPLVDNLMTYMREQATSLSRGHDLVKAMQYVLKRR